MRRGVASVSAKVHALADLLLVSRGPYARAFENLILGLIILMCSILVLLGTLGISRGFMGEMFVMREAVEVHNQPDKALSDGMQSLYPEQFEELMLQVRQIAGVVGRTIVEIGEPVAVKAS